MEADAELKAPADHDRLARLLQVARWYWLDDCDQAQIAGRLSCSVATVSRMLAEARRQNLVQITVAHPLERVLDLEGQLRSRFKLNQAHVISTSSKLDALTPIGQLAAGLLADIMKPTDILGIANGETVAAVVDALPKRHWRDALVVQMIGMLGRENTLIDSPEVVGRAALALGCDHRLLPAPLMVGSSRLAIALRRDEAVRNALALASRADVALIGIGAFHSHTGSGHMFAGLEDDAVRAELARAGAIGHICGHPFDKNGAPLINESARRVMGVELEPLSAIPAVVGVAFGAEKTAAIHAALRGGLMNHLVTDARTASALLH